MEQPLAPWSLTWNEVDPRRHPFDAGSARRTIGALPPASAVPARPSGGAADRSAIAWSHGAGRAWADSMTLALVETYGRWACGWRWAMDEGDIGGGPVGSWCCPRDSITTPDETVSRVVQAVVEWRGWVEDLTERFDRYPLGEASDPDRFLVWEHAAVHLVHHVVDRTSAGDAWYGHCAQVLTWFLARWGIANDQAGRLVDEVIGGRFESWIQPAGTTVAEVAEQFARAAQDSHGHSGHD